MVDDKEDIERREVPHRYYEEIHGRDLRGMKVEKVLPVPSGSFHQPYLPARIIFSPSPAPAPQQNQTVVGCLLARPGIH